MRAAHRSDARDAFDASLVGIHDEHMAPNEIVDWFTRIWADPPAHGFRFLEPFSPDVELIAPLAGRTRGREAGYAAFRRTFALFPDLRAEVHAWGASEDHVWISMTFHTRDLSWPSVDVLMLTDGVVTARRAYFDPLRVVAYVLRRPALAWRWVRIRRARGAPPWPG
ncbi:nuclear transport factor 2 family protein [Sandaracinus amylolyticus]|uniref:SnoaL-like domain-containing protein n=1 Tax=Sandaracinus amylolyticus TaxID=927083 RepID=A0A0F6WA46_9BACT|nr:nuclear transport factor 2 family protein [Sandaracinus amylolyticus]AKF11233.1 hypothetical protein DB32_008382 [Sandaracinus amylolyticus]